MKPGARRKLASMQRSDGERVRAKMADHAVLIWSDEHQAWWRPKCQGYTTHRTYAGIYAFEDAWAATRHCGPEKQIVFEVCRPTEACLSMLVRLMPNES